MTIKMFCQTAAGQSPSVGQSTKVVRLLAIQRPANAASGPNDAIFEGSTGNSSLDIANVAKALFANFTEGVAYDVTITPSTS